MENSTQTKRSIWNRHHTTQIATLKMLFNYDAQYMVSSNQVANGMRS